MPELLTPLPYSIRKCKLRCDTSQGTRVYSHSIPQFQSYHFLLLSLSHGWLYSTHLPRIMSVNERRASHMGAPRPRVASHRVDDAEKAALRSAPSPLQSENMEHLRGSTSSQKSKASREQQNITSEKRTERMTINTKEKTQIRTRNPIRESTSAGNRGEWEKPRPKRATLTDGANPANVRKKEKEPADGQFRTHLPAHCIHILTME